MRLYEYAEFKPTVQWMNTTFRELNKICFDNELPICQFRIAKLARNVLGNFAPHSNTPLYTRVDGSIIYKERVNADGHTAEFPIDIDTEWISQNCKPVISLSNSYSMSEKDWTSVLLHEMCHYSLFMKFKMDSSKINKGHGKLFHSECADAAQKMGSGWTTNYIETSEEIEEIVDDEAVRREAGKVMKGYVVLALYNKNRTQQVALGYLTKEWSLVQELYAYSRKDYALVGIAYLDDKELYAKLALRYKTSRTAFSGSKFTAGFNSMTPGCEKIIEEIKTRKDLKIVLDRTQGIDMNIELGNSIRKGPVCYAIVTEDDAGQLKLYICLKGNYDKVLEDISSYADEEMLQKIRVYDNQDFVYTLINTGYKKTNTGYGSRYDVTQSEMVLPLLDKYKYRDLKPQL